MPMVNVNLPLPADLLAAVDLARKGTPRTTWIRGALQMRLDTTAPPDADLLSYADLPEPAQALMDASLLAEARASVALDGETQAVDAVPYAATHSAVAPAVPGVRHVDDGHLHRAEPYGDPYLNAGGKWQLRRCKDCGKDLPPKRV